MKSYTLYQLNEYVKRVIALNFAEPLWISCEISSIKSSRGSHYLDLTQKDEDTDEIIANAQAVIWYKSYLFIKKKLGELTDSILSDGSEVKIKVQLEFSEKYGLKLVIVDIDASHTLGQHELSKRKIYERLKNEGALELNEALDLPGVIQNIAVISSRTAAGFEDFKSQLFQNQYQYTYDVCLFPAAVQGQKMESEFVEALQSIEAEREEFDCVVIIRGGGSKLDLSGFDNYYIAKEISKMSIPVLVGIGHEIDQTITDLTAHTSLKTPTAVANFIIDHNLTFESDMLRTWEDIKFITLRKISEYNEQLSFLSLQLNNMALNYVNENRRSVEETQHSILRLAKYGIEDQRLKLKYSKQILDNSHPEEILKRGFTIVHQGKKLITRKSKLSLNDDIEIEFSDGKQKIKQS